jgi:hypothetical protein
MATRRWVEDALQALRESLHPVPAELNELDWKAALSPQRDRLVEHLIALANLRNGGTLAYGIESVLNNPLFSGPRFLRSLMSVERRTERRMMRAQRSRSFLISNRRLCPAPQSTACSASPSAPFSGLRPSRPSDFM